MTQTPNPPAGWYPQGDQERWWDGTAWSDNFRPLGSQPTTPMPGYAQPAYGAPTYGQPQYGNPPLQQKSHLARNLLIVFAVLFLLFVGGCVAVVVVVGDKVNDAVNDDTLGGPNNPLTITEGQPFEVAGMEYAAGWDIVDAPVAGLFEIEGLKVTNDRGKADRVWVTIKLRSGGEIVASSNCVADGLDKVPEGVTATLDCASSEDLPTTWDRVTIQDTV